MLTPPPGEPAPQAGEAADDARADDIWNMALPGVQAALEALVWHWGEAYDIGVQDGADHALNSDADRAAAGRIRTGVERVIRQRLRLRL